MKMVHLVRQAIAVFFTFCISCNFSSQNQTKPTFNTFECSYDGFWGDESVFSIKIENTGKVLLSKNRWEPHQYYQGKLSPTDLNTFFLTIQGAQFEKLDPFYVADQIPDKHAYNIWVTTLTHQLQKVEVCGDSVPAKLELLRQSLNLIRDSITLTPISYSVSFPTRARLYPKPPATIKLVPPPDEDNAQ